MAAGVLGLLAIMLIPLPVVLLDMLLATSIALALLLCIAALYAQKPVDFSVFPTLLLVATIFRLALNVASTRLILLNGGNGSSAAGSVIEAFGQFVVGGNYVVGGIVFAILVVINFVVITKGSGRVAEVAARFTLDALPGKQMAIDAELNSGLIDENTARTRRAEITREADFYGAMDGASKFIRGDAIAGLVITAINVVGGVFIGMFQIGMPASEAFETFVLLTIGDGLAGQVPALIVSTAAGIMVTRVEDVRDRALHLQVGGQIFNSPRVVGMAAATMFGLALIPGLRIPFSILGAALAWLAWTWEEPEEEEAPEAEADGEAAGRPFGIQPLEPLAIEVAADLLYLVDDRKSGELLQRIQRIRNQFTEDLGLVVPPVHLRDDLALQPGEYRILLRGEAVAKGKVYPRQHLALDPGTAMGGLPGIDAIDPVFGLDSKWIRDNQVLDAQAKGYTVVDVPTVLSTHVVETVHSHAHELLDGPQLDQTLERVSARDRRLVDDLVPDRMSRQTVLRVFRNLVKESVSIRDSQAILETLAEYAERTSDPEMLTEFVRQRLARHITGRCADEDGAIYYVGFDANAENTLMRALQSSEGRAPSLVLEPDTARKLIVQVKNAIEGYPGPGQAILLAPPLARGALRRMLERVIPRITVVSSAELLPTAKLQVVGSVAL